MRRGDMSQSSFENREVFLTCVILKIFIEAACGEMANFGRRGLLSGDGVFDTGVMSLTPGDLASRLARVVVLSG